MQDLPKDVQEEISAAFGEFDPEKNGSIRVAELKDIMRCLGQNPSDDEWAKIKASIGSDELEREKYE